ncbi:MAG: hypothetical protein V3R78_10090 [Thermodesulfobacteriota bacterium]
MSIQNNGSAVSKSVTTTGIEEFANQQDNTFNDDPPADISNVKRPGPGKDQG